MHANERQWGMSPQAPLCRYHPTGITPDAPGKRSEAFAFQPLALQLAGTAHRFRGLARAPLGRFFVVPPELHLAENPLPLHLLLERLQRLIDVVVTHEDLHLAACSFHLAAPACRGRAKITG